MAQQVSRFYSSLGLLIFLNIIIKPVWIFGIDREVQNTVGTAEYGVYFSVFSLSAVLGFLLDLGLTNYYNRELAARSRPFGRQAGNFLLVKLLLAILYTCVLILVALLTRVDRWDIVGGLIGIQVLTSFFVFLRAVITAEQWFRTDAFLSVLDKTLMILFCGSLLFFPAVFGRLDIGHFLRFQVLSTGIAVVLTGFILFRRGITFRRYSFSSFFSEKIWMGALPYGLIFLLMSAHYRLDGFLLEQIHPDGAREAGIYAASYRLLDAANMIGVLFASFVLPYIARQWTANQDITPVILRTRHVLLGFSVMVTCTVFFLAPWIHGLLYDASGFYEADVLQWSLPALLGYSLVSIYGTVMTATGHIRAFCVITFFSVLLNITVNLLLIPSMGAKGCCIAALVSQGACGMAVLLFVHKKLGVPVHFRSCLIYIFIGAAISGFLLLARNTPVSPWWKIAGAGMIAAGLLLATGLFEIRKWKRLVYPLKEE